MPIHDFRSLEKVEKEVEEGKAKEIDSQITNIELPKSKPEPKTESQPPKSKPKPNHKPKQKIKQSHPMVQGLLEIEEEEL